VVRQAPLIFEVLGSNNQGLYFLTIKTTNAVGQADMWVQGDICAEFKIELDFDFEQDLK
jgi:hypothetical protein